MSQVDTSALLSVLTGSRSAVLVMRGFISDGIWMGVSAPVLYEWLRGPRTPEELEAQERLLPSTAVFPFGLEEARLAADLYGRMKRPRHREIDIAIAACAIANDASLWIGLCAIAGQPLVKDL